MLRTQEEPNGLVTTSPALTEHDVSHEHPDACICQTCLDLNEAYQAIFALQEEVAGLRHCLQRLTMLEG